MLASGQVYEPKSPSKQLRDKSSHAPPALNGSVVSINLSPCSSSNSSTPSLNSPYFSPGPSPFVSPRPSPPIKQAIPLLLELPMKKHHDIAVLPASTPSSPGSLNLKPPTRHRRRASDGEALFRKQKQVPPSEEYPSDVPRKSLPVVIPISQLGSVSSRIASKSFWNIEMLLERERMKDETDKLPSIDTQSHSSTVPNSPEASPPPQKRKGLKHSKSECFTKTSDSLKPPLLSQLQEKRWSKPELPVTIAPAKAKRRVSLNRLPPMRHSTSNDHFKTPVTFSISPLPPPEENHL